MLFPCQSLSSNNFSRGVAGHAWGAASSAKTIQAGASVWSGVHSGKPSPCLPLSPIEKQIQTSQGYRLSYQILHYISEHFTEPLTLESTAHALGISRIHLSHIFSQQLHVNFRQHISTLRIDRACKHLRDPSNTVSQVAYLCGYSNPRTFHRAFLSQCGMPPKQYRARLSLPIDPENE